jgi:hypothetical protein
VPLSVITWHCLAKFDLLQINESQVQRLEMCQWSVGASMKKVYKNGVVDLMKKLN